jgi:hypothetical protein
MEKLIVKEEVKFLNNVIFKKGEIIDKSDSYNVEIESGNIAIFYSMIENFVEPYQDIEIRISNPADDEEEKIWRMQLDVKTTRKKAIEIENFLRKTLREMI